MNGTLEFDWSAMKACFHPNDDGPLIADRDIPRSKTIPSTCRPSCRREHKGAVTGGSQISKKRRCVAMFPVMLLGLVACDQVEVPTQQRVINGDREAGRAVIAAVACGICHVIPGIRGASGIVGPSLAGFGRRQLIGGVAPNQPAVLAQWVRNAPSIAPNTGMPELPLSEAQARDVAAYLLTLR